MKIVQQSVELLWSTPDAERVIELAGRTAYQSEGRITPGSAPKFIRRLISMGHESVLEHACASLRIVTDRGVSHELVRHRIASFTQESTRYCAYGELTVVDPFTRDDTLAEWEAWQQTMLACEMGYQAMRTAGARPEIARAALPTCTKTQLVMTTNLREWRHIIRLRIDLAAHPQMRALAELMLGVLRGVAPTVFEDFGQEGGA